ncbi:unnamed protein product [Protopolystoma xenopodis]|uniref:Uncharacterized protein n=1 Tax=Protopolystoma xenopodis TaxID=117903 RepID=A0A3S5AHV6_9PLAT|nr:unnamed protein product [Protopolystoma xenopodis]
MRLFPCLFVVNPEPDFLRRRFAAIVSLPGPRSLGRLALHFYRVLPKPNPRPSAQLTPPPLLRGGLFTCFPHTYFHCLQFTFFLLTSESTASHCPSSDEVGVIRPPNPSVFASTVYVAELHVPPREAQEVAFDD